MHLVLITQKIDETDDILGFTGYWLRSLSRHVDELTCLALTVGEFSNPPANVTVRSLDKESRPQRWRLALALHQELSRICASRRVDAILAHMAPVYAVLSYPTATRHRIPIYLWYTHRVVDVWLRAATAIARVVFTADEESFRLPASKRRVMGHGIPVERFRDPLSSAREILAVGRISPVKKLEVLIRAASMLPDEDLCVRIVGAEALASDRAYREGLEELVDELEVGERIVFEGSVPYSKVPRYYARSLLTVDPCAEGFDKAVLESMASARACLTANSAFAPLLGDDAKMLVFRPDDPRELASKIRYVLQLSDAERASLGERLRRSVEESHGLDRLAEGIVRTMAEERSR